MNGDLLQVFLSNPNFFDPRTLIGIGLAMHVEVVVEYLKTNWYLPNRLAPFAASLIAVLVQVGICLFYHIPLGASVVGAIATTAATCWWHEIKK